jgi:hypothetical protein
MVVGFILLAVTLVFLAAASWSDIKSREVADEISLGFFASVLAIRLAYSILAKEPDFFLVPFLVSAGFLLFGLGMYQMKQWGGGDLLLLVGLGAAFGTLPADLASFFPAIKNSFFPFWAVFLVNILVVGSVYGICFIAYYLLASSNLRKNFLGQVEKNWLILGISLILSLLSFKFIGFPGSFLTIALFGILLLILLSKSVESEIFVKKVNPNDLRVEDWLVEDVKAHGRVIVAASTPGLTKEDIAAIRRAYAPGKLANPRILVKEGIPFVPVFPLSLLLSIAVGDLLTLFLFSIYRF